MQCRLHEELDRADLGMIVFDSLAAGWALKAVLEHVGSRRRQKLIYVSHNHEASLRAGLAAEQPRRIKRIAHRLDAGKVARLERELIRACDLVTAITPEDADRYRAVWPSKRIEVLTPGYAGSAVASRIIGKAVPRRAVIVGSFEWIAKQMNLEEFVGFADPILAAGNAELQVIGSGERTFFDRLEKRTAATHFTGTVDRVENFMAGARIAIVPERNGGGFKLKVLDYVFNRLPIVALAGSIAGTPLRDHESVLLFPDQRSLATGVLRAMDDVDELNRLQESAFSICRDAFDWHSRGRQLVSSAIRCDRRSRTDAPWRCRRGAARSVHSRHLFRDRAAYHRDDPCALGHLRHQRPHSAVAPAQRYRAAASDGVSRRCRGLSRFDPVCR